MSDHASDDHNAIDGATKGFIIVVSGAPEAGKSTVSHLIAAAFDRSVHLNVDDLLASSTQPGLPSRFVTPSCLRSEPVG